MGIQDEIVVESRYEEVALEDFASKESFFFLFPSRLPTVDNFFSSFVFRPTFYFASCISCPPATRRFSHVSTHTRIHTHTYLAYAQRYSLFRSCSNVQTRRTRPTRDTCCSFLPSFLPCLCLCFEVTVIRSKGRPSYVIYCTFMCL